MPHASTRMRTWPAPGSETCRSTTRSTPGAETSTALYVPCICVCLSSAFHSGLRVLPFADGDHQKHLGVTRKMVDVRLTIRSVLVQCLHHLLIQSDDHDVWPNVEFIAASHRMRLSGPERVRLRAGHRTQDSCFTHTERVGQGAAALGRRQDSRPRHA